MSEDKTEHFKAIRQHFSVNPARSYACGDEKKDFLAAVQTGMHPFMVSYGFEDFDRLTRKIGVPPELISRDPAELRARVAHALDLRASQSPRPSACPRPPTRQGASSAAAGRAAATPARRTGPIARESR